MKVAAHGGLRVVLAMVFKGHGECQALEHAVLCLRAGGLDSFVDFQHFAVVGGFDFTGARLHRDGTVGDRDLALQRGIGEQVVDAFLVRFALPGIGLECGVRGFVQDEVFHQLGVECVACQQGLEFGNFGNGFDPCLGVLGFFHRLALCFRDRGQFAGDLGSQTFEHFGVGLPGNDRGWHQHRQRDDAC